MTKKKLDLCESPSAAAVVVHVHRRRRVANVAKPWTATVLVPIALVLALGVAPAPTNANFVSLVASKVGDSLTDFLGSWLNSWMKSHLPEPFKSTLLTFAASRLFDIDGSPAGVASNVVGGDGYYKYDYEGVDNVSSADGYNTGQGMPAYVGHAGQQGEKFLSNKYFRHLEEPSSSSNAAFHIDDKEQDNYISSSGDEGRTFTSWLFGGAVCYDFYGCFALGRPWFDPPRRIINLPPRNPDEVQPKHFLYTRLNQANPQLITSDSKVVTASGFLGTRATKLIIFGHGDFAQAPWILAMKDALLQKEDANVIIVDWHPAFFQLQARADARLAGSMTAMLVLFLKEKHNLDFANVHVIGQGLGAHMGSYVCRSLKSDQPFSDPVIGRLTALDPMDVGFTDTDPMVRVDPSDARFVDVIHSDVHKGKEGVGTSQNMGHVDFFPNGGTTPQPGCDLKLWDAWDQGGGSITEAFRKYFYCSHFRAADYFTQSINIAAAAPATTCQFRSVSCDNWESFVSGTCGLSCPADGTSNARCIRMGYNAQADFVPTAHNGVAFYLRTKSSPAFCQFQYYVNVHVGSLLRTKRGIARDDLIMRTSQQNNKASDLMGADDTSRTARFMMGALSKAIVGDMYISFRDSQGNFVGSTFKMNGKPLKVYYGTRVTGIINEDAQLPVQRANADRLDGEIHMTFVPYFDFNQEMLVPDITLTSVETSKSFKMCSDGVIGGRKWHVIPIVFKPC